MFYSYTFWASESDRASLTLSTLGTIGLGSTVGLLVVAGIGLSRSSSGNSGNRTFGSIPPLVLDYAYHSRRAMYVWLERAKSTKPWQAFGTVSSCVWFGVVYACYVPLAIVRTLEDMIIDFHTTYGEMDWRKFCKLMRIFKIWEPLPYDLMVGQSPEVLKQAFEDKRDQGLVGVCLRFRCGALWHRVAGSEPARSLHGRHISVPAYLPLEQDGRLRVDLIREKFHIDEVELVVPGHWKSYRVTKGDIISPFMLHELVQEFNCVNVVEYEDIFCQHRRRFRQWLLSTRLHYFVRVSCYFAVLFSIVLAAFSGGTYLSGLLSGRLWWCLSHAFAYISGPIVIIMFFEHRRKNYEDENGSDVPWHTFPRRYSKYWICDRFRGKFM